MKDNFKKLDKMLFKSVLDGSNESTDILYSQEFVLDELKIPKVHLINWLEKNEYIQLHEIGMVQNWKIYICLKPFIIYSTKKQTPDKNYAGPWTYTHSKWTLIFYRGKITTRNKVGTVIGTV